MKKRKSIRKIPVDDVFDTDQNDFANCDSILSFAESLGREEEKFRLGFLKTRRERIEEKNEFIFNESIDYPESVLGSFKDKNKNLLLRVSFRQRSNGIIPEPTFLSVKFIASRFSQFLIDYYESIVK